MRTPKQYFRDLFRPAAPPPDERPAEFFPHAFFTPRALRDMRALEKKRGRQLCVLVDRMPRSGEIDSLATPYGNLVTDQLVRITCPEVPCYVARKLHEEYPGYVIDHIPLPNDLPGTRTPNVGFTIELPWPPGATASDPGMLRIDMVKLGRMHPEVLPDAAALQVIEPVAKCAFHMLFADANPAIVVATKPQLIVSAFSGDIDCVVLLRFPPDVATGLIEELDLKPGRRLMSLNSYRDDEEGVAADLTPGPKYSAWTNYNPYIAEFLANDRERIAQLHADMPEWAWQRCREMTVEATRKRPLRPRDGRPLRSVKPAHD